MAAKNSLHSVPVQGAPVRKTVVLVDSCSDRRTVLRRAFREFGYELLAQHSDLDALPEEFNKAIPDILVLGVDMPDWRYLEKVASLSKLNPLPVVIFAEKGAPAIVERSVKAGVSAFVVDDIQPQRIPSILTVAVARFKEKQSLVNELHKTKSKLAERKVVEKAKGLLMEKQSYTEEQAYAMLRKLAMDQGKSIAYVAETTISLLNALK